MYRSNHNLCSNCIKVSNLLHNEQHHLNPVEAKDISTDISTPNYKRGIIGPEDVRNNIARFGDLTVDTRLPINSLRIFSRQERL
ncbi:4371_t:CDS:2 [Diversispora eburnea]|uniref:4371_t:CDS:1 n=1 Tax=Diversispora eburnea TaxID=1213867 RepID=A0A9N8V261_9GLOM|nr:4371_t:CDS:2 [Diversispora eburnea]